MNPKTKTKSPPKGAGKKVAAGATATRAAKPKPKAPAKGRAKKMARKKAAKKAVKRALPAEIKKPGRPTLCTAELVGRICAGLSEGIPLAVICRGEDMPDPATVWRWRQEDEEISQAIARAREEGFDAIAHETLRIADDNTKDLLSGEFGDKPNTAAVMRDKLRIDTRLNLLAKWDPKRYGTKVSTEISGPNGGAVPVRQEVEISPELEAKLLEAAALGAALEPPACLNGQGMEAAEESPDEDE